MLETFDLTRTLDPETHEPLFTGYQLQLRRLMHRLAQRRSHGVLAVFEGWDAAGKGGVIKRLVVKLNPRHYQVFAYAAPTLEERGHNYLWRFWRNIPERGSLAVFDRSWYGRVLVERVEGFCSDADWRRAYREINNFERQLVEANYLVFKFWIHISPEEQLARFAEREDNMFKSWKLTDEDWRNRANWEVYLAAVEEMLLKTSTVYAPWTVVEGNDKLFARTKVIRTLVERLEQVVGASEEVDHQGEGRPRAPGQLCRAAHSLEDQLWE